MNIFLTNAFLLCTAKLGNNLTKNIPNVNKSLLQYLTAPSQDSFFLFFTTTGEIEINIIGLNANKFTGPYSIPVAILKLPNMLYLHLQKLYSVLSFLLKLSQIYLKQLKLPLFFKKVRQTSLNNYLPISILSIFNKLLEALMFKRILEFLEKEIVLASVRNIPRIMLS